MKLVGVSIVSAFLVAVVGVTPGYFFVTLMVTLEYNIAVATATGMFLVMLTAVSGSINMIVFQLLDLRYSLLINLMTILGTLPGVYGQDLIVRLTGNRYQFTVLILLGLVIFFTVMIPILHIRDLFAAIDMGEDIWAINSYCK